MRTTERLTDGQLRALVMVARARATSTGKAYVSGRTVAFDHLVRVNANAVASLKKLGLVETWVEYHPPLDATFRVDLTAAGGCTLSKESGRYTFTPAEVDAYEREMARIQAKGRQP
jgi:hypothetical protein